MFTSSALLTLSILRETCRDSDGLDVDVFGCDDGRRQAQGHKTSAFAAAKGEVTTSHQGIHFKPRGSEQELVAFRSSDGCNHC